MNSELLKRIISSIIILPLSIIIIIKGSFYFNIFLILCFIISIYEWFKITKNKKYLFSGILFLSFSFYTIYQIKYNFNDGLMYLLLILAICIATDLGGFFFGKFLGGPKLTKISPNKTYSGMLGSFFFPLMLIYFYSKNTDLIYSFDLNIKIIIFTILVSTISQVGDLTISYFKRLSKVKNTGNIIPGHGGLLDRIDGMIFAFPFSYMFFLIVTLDIL